MSREGYRKCDLGNDLEFTDAVVNEMLLILVEEASDKFWRVLKYGATDIVKKPQNYPITTEDKYEMIKQNNVDSDGSILTKVKVNKFNHDISTDAHSEIRLFNASWSITEYENNYSLLIGLEVISHNKSIVLDGTGELTINILRHELYRIFNNSYVYKSVGKMSNVGARGSIAIFNEDYQGYQFGLITHST